MRHPLTTLALGLAGIAAALALTAGTALAATPTSTPGQPAQSSPAYFVQRCNGLSCDGEFPQMHNDCLRSAYDVKWQNVDGGLVELKYSPACGAFFGVSTASTPSQYTGTSIVRFNPDTQYYQNSPDEGTTSRGMISQMIGWNGQPQQRVRFYGCVASGYTHCADIWYP